MARVLAVLVLAAAAHTASAQSQRYDEPWKKAADGRYFIEYLYKSKPTDRAFKKQYVFYDRKDPHWVYWVNPKSNPDNKSGKDSYWARCPTKANPTWGKAIKAGKDVWSILPAADRVNEFAGLKRAKFPEDKEMAPPVPGAAPGDKRTIPCPPDPPDLPK